MIDAIILLNAQFAQYETNNFLNDKLVDNCYYNTEKNNMFL